MKAAVLVLLCLYCSVECRKAYVPVDKNANLAFINMEAGGGVRPAPSPNQPPAASNPPVKPQPVPANVKPGSPASATPPPVKPITMVAPTPAKPEPSVAKPAPDPVKPSPMKPGSPSPVTTPGPGTVKQLVNFYDSQGKASPIRPYSYSQAVKQG